MRFLATLLAFACLTSLLAADERQSQAVTANPQADEPQADESVRFDGETLGLAFAGEDPDATIKEFLPAGQKLESWTRLAAIRNYSDLDDPVAYASAVVKDLKEKYPKSPSELQQNTKTGAVVLDFVVWPEDISFVEFNVFRYEKRPGGGLISQQYAVRAYGDEAAAFLDGLQKMRARVVEKMAHEGLQLEAVTSSVEDAPQ